ncbi:MAG TPA: transcriptional regulator [Candidatus Polarisedimenticolaceae bacterium]|nr:transcriptional regulator [Candidatus Polarisedimenticolaceae bacterium]
MADRQSASQRQSASARAQSKRLEALAGYLADRSAGEFDRLVYERIRLGIMSALAVNRTMSFSDLKDLLRTSDGNLSVHARKLEDAGYIACSKSFEGRFPKTEYRLTATGRAALERYLNHMEALIDATRGE